MGHYILRPARKPGHHAMCSHDKEGGEPASGSCRWPWAITLEQGSGPGPQSVDHLRCLSEEAQGEHAPRDHTEAGRSRKTKSSPKRH